MLGRAARMAATYAYFVANAGAEEAAWLANEVASREKRALYGVVQGRVTEAFEAAGKEEEPGASLAESLAKIRGKIDYSVGRGVEAVRSVERLALGSPMLAGAVERLASDLREAGEDSWRIAEAAVLDYAEARGLAPLPRPRKRRLSKLERDAEGMVPRRIYRGPVSVRPWLRRLSPGDREAFWRLGKEHEEAGVLGTLAMYWADGGRSLLEVSGLVELEAGRTDLEYLVGYFGLLGKMGLVELGPS